MAGGKQHIPFESFRLKEVQGRYLPPALLSAILQKYLPPESISSLGYSVQQRHIYQVRLGSGPVRVYMWSQMHGNESTPTKALLDLMFYLQSKPASDAGLLEKLQLCLIPMVNPDGAEAYTRVNANQVDLNRDAAERTQPESVVLRKAFEDFRPDFCFNLHDQRSIYGVGDTGVSATLSFLAPSADLQRSITPAREQAMRLIAGLAAGLEPEIPGGIGRYDDSFNASCVGDQFQRAGVPTLLVEAGHFPGDYARETTRRMVFAALLEALRLIARKSYQGYTLGQYHAIPENRKNFADILIRQPGRLHKRYSGLQTLLLQYEERLQNGKLLLLPSLPEDGLTEGAFGHAVYDASRREDRERLMAHPALAKLFS